MTTLKLTAPEAIEAQLTLEALSMQMGIARYHETLASDGLTGLPPGKQLMKAAMKPMIEALVTWKEQTEAGLASRNAASFYFLDGIDVEAVAWITASCCLSRLHEQPKVVSLATHIAMRLEQTVNIDAIAKVNPKLADKIAKRTNQVAADKNRMVFIRKGAELVDVRVVAWDDMVRIRLGSLLVEMFCQSTGLITTATKLKGKNTEILCVRPTESCLRWLEESHARCELLSPVRLPMVCMPRHWTNPFNGGYLTPELRQSIVKTRNNGYLTTLKEWSMPLVYASINTLQDTEWAINKGVYETVKSLWEAGSEVAGLPSRIATPLPSKGWDDSEGAPAPDPAILHAWKVDAAKAYEVNAKAQSKRLQLVQKLWTAEVMVDRGNRFHFVYTLDWRGRIYPVAPGLSPQGDDVSKAMLQFSHGVALGDNGAYWLAVHGANSFGMDKIALQERVEWTDANIDMILSCASRPLDDTRWMDAEAPFTFLAFCLEWAKLDTWVQAGLPEATFMSHLPVAFDGACNGLQNFSALLRDPIGGKATGLVPGEKPADIYSEVAKAAQVLIDDAAGRGNEVAKRWVGKMTRKLAKRNTMTVPYGVTKRGMRDQLFAELTDSEGYQRAEDAEFLAECNYTAISKVVVAASLAMDWLRDAAKVAASNKLPVRWTTPAGFLAVQDYREEVGDVLDFKVLGRRFQLMVMRTGDSLNSRKQALGISPNFVHSLDAAHLMRTVLFCVQDGITDFAMIHDSYGCHAGHAETLRDNLRAAFVEQYSQPVLEKFRSELLTQLPPELQEKLPPLPPMGDLDLEQVRASEYFFA